MSDLESNTVSLRDYLDARFDAIAARFDAIDARFDAVDARFDAVDARFDAVDARFDGVDKRLDKLEARLGNLEVAVEGNTKAIARFDGAYSVFEPAVWIIAGSLIAVILEKRFRWFSKAWHWICGTSQ